MADSLHDKLPRLIFGHALHFGGLLRQLINMAWHSLVTGKQNAFSQVLSGDLFPPIPHILQFELRNMPVVASRLPDSIKEQVSKFLEVRDRESLSPPSRIGGLNQLKSRFLRRTVLFCEFVISILIPCLLYTSDAADE